MCPPNTPLSMRQVQSDAAPAALTRLVERSSHLVAIRLVPYNMLWRQRAQRLENVVASEDCLRRT
eukprot:scaffold21491_cov37-Tisochrysis_lutea.AAC.3